MSNKLILKRLRLALLPACILGASLLAALVFIKTAPSPQKKKSQPMAFAVKTLTVATRRHNVTLAAMGTVVPVQEVALQSEVTGLVISKHRNLVPGGIVRQGETLLRIDARNYQAILRQYEASVARAEAEYQFELSRSEVAAEEWRMIEPDNATDSRAKSLALREPQLRAAEAAVQAASNALAKAALDVERTRIVAPFNSVVIDEFIDRGQLVSTQTRLAQLAGTDAFRVEVSLPVRDLRWIKWPNKDGEGGPAATVLYDIGDAEPLQFKGKVTRVLSSLDNAAKMARILVRVHDPLKLAKTPADTPNARLLSGAYVKVLIEGLSIENVIKVPDAVIHEGNRVWVMNQKMQLEFRDVEVLWRQGGKALVKSGIVDGERLVSSHISSPIPGMKLRVKGAPTPKKGPDSKKKARQ